MKGHGSSANNSSSSDSSLRVLSLSKLNLPRWQYRPNYLSCLSNFMIIPSYKGLETNQANFFGSMPALSIILEEDSLDSAYRSTWTPRLFPKSILDHYDNMSNTKVYPPFVACPTIICQAALLTCLHQNQGQLTIFLYHPPH